MMLVGFQPRCVDGVEVVKNLNLHSVVSSVLAHGGTDTYTIVCTCCELELETEDKVAILVLCVEVTEAAATFAYCNSTIFSSVVCLVTLPLVE